MPIGRQPRDLTSKLRVAYSKVPLIVIKTIDNLISKKQVSQNNFHILNKTICIFVGSEYN